MDLHSHWQNVYQSKAVDDVSWYQAKPSLSLDLIDSTRLDHSATLIDVGAGASLLLDNLLERGYKNISLLDISEEALAVSRQRIGAQAENLTWLVGDITTIALPENAYSLWHDRAVFHFLGEESQRQAYLAQVKKSLKQGGFLLMATFAEDGPEQCSGLTVSRYTAESLQAFFGDDFQLMQTQHESHITPWQSEQRFVYCLFKRG